MCLEGSTTGELAQSVPEGQAGRGGKGDGGRSSRPCWVVAMKVAGREVMARPGGDGHTGDLGGQESNVVLDVLTLKCLGDVQVEVLVDS